MRARFHLFLLCGWVVGGGGLLLGENPPAAPAKLNVVDYFLRLPKDALEGPAKGWLMYAHVDRPNGFISVPGDGAQPSFEVALFRFRDGGALLALGTTELESESARLVYLRFFKQAADGGMHEVKRPEFPEKNAEHHYFDLPRVGRTIVVREARNGRVLQRLTWNGEKF